ncbi:homoserine dehydrogenase [Paenibacillus silviterrae]|uniref:homoserine dehydrogenase n=1 Tax=Paenibacillus silviterrae TaxID=3242194 RepID=UPI0025437996|nr:homoserine dehydrogenase [Paenibacillus chinjuensis]
MEQTRDSIGIALLGLGTVGSGVVKALTSNAERQKESFGGKIELCGVLVQDLSKPRSVDIHPELLFDNYKQLSSHRRLQVVIEVMGGVEPAKTYIEEALRSKKHVITANKELMAKHGSELLRLAKEMGVHLLYEASVGGGIPILGVLSQFLRYNKIERISGILNGTTNFILTKMMLESLDYETVLAEAQALGFAEADPTSDVEGYDSMYKLIILARLAWGVDTTPEQVIRRGITHLTSNDIAYAKEQHARWKLIASAEKFEDGTVQLTVEPRLIPEGHPLYGVMYEFNAVHLSGNLVGELTFSGRGAGEMPTSSAILEDLAYAMNHSPETIIADPVNIS